MGLVTLDWRPGAARALFLSSLLDSASFLHELEKICEEEKIPVPAGEDA
ncbi:MAG: hypothetical protein ACR2IF_09625 [Terriglobales bacterium]